MGIPRHIFNGLERGLDKARLVFRAIYASVSSKKARKLAEQYRAVELKQRHSQRENKILLRALQAAQGEYPNLNLDIIKQSQLSDSQPILSDGMSWILYDMIFHANIDLLLKDASESSDHNFTHIIAHDILGIGAARAISTQHKAKLWIDLVEDHILEERSGDYYRHKFSQGDHKFVRTYIDSHIKSADHVIHIGDKQAERFKSRLGLKGKILPNYRDTLNVTSDKLDAAQAHLRKDGLDQKPFFVVPNTIRHSSEISPILKSLEANAMPHVLVHMGNSIAENILSEIPKALRARFITLGALEYDHYLTILSLSKGAVMITAETNNNIHDALPNRLFDSISACVPILSLGYPEIAKFIDVHGIGTASSVLPSQVKINAACREFLSRHAEFKSKVDTLSKTLSWDKEVQDCFSGLAESSNILIISRKTLDHHQRTNRMASSLRKMGHEVMVIGGSRTHLRHAQSRFTVPYTVPLSHVDYIKAQR